MPKFMIPLIALGAAFGSSAAMAQSVRIDLSGVDLSSAAGKASLERQIAAAERLLCPETTPTGSRIANTDEARQCRAEVRQQVAARVAKHTAAQVAARH